MNCAWHLTHQYNLLNVAYVISIIHEGDTVNMSCCITLVHVICVSTSAANLACHRVGSNFGTA